MQNPRLMRITTSGPRRKTNSDSRTSASLTGPVYLPKLYNATTRPLHLGFDGLQLRPSPWVVEAVPSLAQRQVDFSGLLTIARSIRLRPYSTFGVGRKIQQIALRGQINSREPD